MKAYIVQPHLILGARAVRIADAIARMRNVSAIAREDGERKVRWLVQLPGTKQWGIETLRKDGRWHLAAYMWDDVLGYRWHEFATADEAATAAAEMLREFGTPRIAA